MSFNLLDIWIDTNWMAGQPVEVLKNERKSISGLLPG